MFQGRIYRNARFTQDYLYDVLSHCRRGQKGAVGDGKKAAVTATERREAQNAGVERRGAREMSWAERRCTPNK